jgi:hypothetical protein
VHETLGLGAYALYSEACVAAMGLADPASAGLVEHRATYEGVGEVAGWVRDLEAAWQAEQAATRVFVEPADATWSIETFVPAPPDIAWEWFTSPARRPVWQGGVDEVRETVQGGRRGVGTTNHCVHGRNAIVEEVLDWRPVEYLTSRVQVPMPGVPRFTITDLFEPLPGGTRVTSRVLRPRSAKDRAVLKLVTPVLASGYRGRAASAAHRGDVAERAAAGAGIEAGTAADPGASLATGSTDEAVDSTVPFVVNGRRGGGQPRARRSDRCATWP